MKDSGSEEEAVDQSEDAVPADRAPMLEVGVTQGAGAVVVCMSASRGGKSARISLEFDRAGSLMLAARIVEAAGLLPKAPGVLELPPEPALVGVRKKAKQKWR